MSFSRRRLAAVGLAGVAALSLGAAGGAAATTRTTTPVWQLGHHAHLFPIAGAAVGSLAPREHALPLIGGAPIGLPLEYGGGPVEVTNTNYAIFWDPAGALSSSYTSLIARYFGDVGGSALFGTTTQYYQTVNGSQQNIQNVSTYGGSYVDHTPFPDANLTDNDIRAAVLRATAAKGWTGEVGHEFFVYTPLGAITLSNFCAYHDWFSSGSQTLLYANMLYGGQPGCTVPTSPNNNQPADSVLDSTSHEQWETITDGVVGTGWTALDGEEGSDECGHTYGPTNAAGADTLMNGHPYILQKEWSNAQLLFGCVMS